MPFKSEAQRKLFQRKVARGEISYETFKKWESETGDTKLPLKLGKKIKKEKK